VPRNTPPDATAFLPLTAVVFDILVALGDGESHGYAIMKEIEGRSGTPMRPGTLYRALGRLLDDGLVREVAEAVPGDDERRRYYGLTALGRRVVGAEARRLTAAVEAARSKRLLEDAGA
jgi:DNA-binding PadR family transcriptional regulator